MNKILLLLLLLVIMKNGALSIYNMSAKRTAIKWCFLLKEAFKIQYMSFARVILVYIILLSKEMLLAFEIADRDEIQVEIRKFQSKGLCILQFCQLDTITRNK